MIIPGYFSINEDDIILKEELFKCDEIFKNIMYLASSININSSLSLCNLYLYLLYSGNLSKNISRSNLCFSEEQHKKHMHE